MPQKKTTDGQSNEPAQKTDPQATADLEGLSIEDAFGKLDEIVASLEKEDSTLEDSFQAYQEGMRVLLYCNGQIDAVEKKVQQISENGELHDF